MSEKAVRSPVRDILFRLVLVTLASLIIAVNMKSFVQAGDLFPGGFTGLARLTQRAAWEFWGVDIPFSPVYLLLNAVPAAISFRFVGKKFTLYSCQCIVLVSIFTDLVPTIPITEDLLLICVFGGLITGFAVSLCLRARATSGGTDFIAIALSERKNIDAWNYILAGNAVMLTVARTAFRMGAGPVFHHFPVYQHSDHPSAGPGQRPGHPVYRHGTGNGGGRVCPDTGYPPYRYFDRGGWPVQWGALRYDLYGGQRGRKQGPGP